jgi:hypothetical protein
LGSKGSRFSICAFACAGEGVMPPLGFDMPRIVDLWIASMSIAW